jgi:hypothetical protein
MDKYAQKLLDKQLRGIVAPRHDAVMVLAIVTVFFAGMPVGSGQFAPVDCRSAKSFALMLGGAIPRGRSMPDHPI